MATVTYATVNPATKRDVRHELNRSLPAARDAKLGDVLVDLTTLVNALAADLAALTTKYNATLVLLAADVSLTDHTTYTAQGSVVLTSQSVPGGPVLPKIGFRV